MNETVTLYKCDNCTTLIRTPDQGVVVHGNILAADPTTYGGLIGNNFPKDLDTKFTADEVMKTVLCVPCFMKAVLPDAKLTNTREF